MHNILKVTLKVLGSADYSVIMKQNRKCQQKINSQMPFSLSSGKLQLLSIDRRLCIVCWNREENKQTHPQTQIPLNLKEF